MNDHSDVQKAVQRLAEGQETVESTMKVVDDYVSDSTGRRTTAAHEVAQAVQVLAFFALVGFVFWLFLAR